MVQTKNIRICEIVSGAVNRVSEGEVIQLLNIHDTTVNEERYFEVIERKTGVLFEAAARMAATIGGATSEEEEKLTEYALALGTAFQIIDDVLDYRGEEGKTGKTLGADLREGKMTMPLIYALRKCSEEQAAQIKEAVKRGDGDLEAITRILNETGAIEECVITAKQIVSSGIEAISFLKPSLYKESLIKLLSLTVERDL